MSIIETAGREKKNNNKIESPHDQNKNSSVATFLFLHE